jgi:predicted transcriptional regulator
MKTITVKELMVPIEEYAKVYQEANLYEAVCALEKAQEAVEPWRHKHRAILVLDNQQKVIGKISIFHILTALEPKYHQLEAKGVLTRSGYSPELIKDLLKDYALWTEPMEFVCTRAGKLKVSDIMETPADELYIEENATLDEAMHQLVVCRNQSLLVMRANQVFGVLRLSDIFAKVCEKIKSCRF